MTLRDIALVLTSCGALMLAAILIRRYRNGAWSLEDEEVPAPSADEMAMAVGGGLLACLGLALFVWSYLGNGVG